MTATLAPEHYDVSAGETRAFSVGFKGKLDSSELLTGTPTVTEVTTTDLTITQKRTNTAAVTINGESHAIGEAVQFLVTGALANKDYQILITCGTNATYAQTLQAVVGFSGVAAS